MNDADRRIREIIMQKTKILKEADLYVISNRGIIDEKFRQVYHIMPPIGWMNDPNGVCYAFGKYHVFFQFHPYKAEWGPMHWGHYTSKDLIHWNWEGVALAPDNDYDSFGCFSGSAIMHNNELCLLYTGVTENKQEQVLVRSKDGICFDKFGVVIDRTKLPEGALLGEFRDPKVFKRADRFYIVVGSKTEEHGIVLLFDSDDLVNWHSRGILWEDPENSAVSECPDLFCVNGKDVLTYCISKNVNGKPQLENRYIIGCFDEKKGTFKAESMEKLDHGDSFFAAQTLLAEDGRTILFAWMNTWREKFYTAPFGWVGSLTFPRVVNIKDGGLVQLPAVELKELFVPNESIILDNVSIGMEKRLNDVGGLSLSLKLCVRYEKAGGFGIKLFKGEKEPLILYFDKKKDAVTVTSVAENKTYSCPCFEENGRIYLHILLDKTSAEIFVGNGKRVLTFNINPDWIGEDITFYAVDGEAIIEKLEFNPINNK